MSVHLVLAEEEGQEHQHASIMDDPPNIDVTLGEALSVGREGRDVLRDEQGQVSRRGLSHQLCVQREAKAHTLKSWISDLTGSVFAQVYESHPPTKFLQVWCSSPCFQLRGQDTRTALCFRPPRPLAWRRWEVASRRLEDTVTWLKPFTFSVSISFRSAWKEKERKNEGKVESLFARWIPNHLMDPKTKLIRKKKRTIIRVVMSIRMYISSRNLF